MQQAAWASTGEIMGVIVQLDFRSRDFGTFQLFVAFSGPFSIEVAFFKGPLRLLFIGNFGGFAPPPTVGKISVKCAIPPSFVKLVKNY